MAHRFRQFVLAIGCVLLTPQLILADDGLTLESLAEKVGSLFQSQDDLKLRMAAIETHLAPTPTKTLRPTATPRIGVTATAKAKVTAQSRFKSRATTTAISRSRATATTRAKATSTAKASQSGTRKYGLCSFPDVPNPPYRDLDCDV